MTDRQSPVEHIIDLNLQDAWPRAYSHRSENVANATIKQEHNDFIVSEILGFEPSGEGEHELLWIEKAGFNSEYLAKKIAKLAAVKPVDIGFCGMKDRHALTRQWYSVHLPGKAGPDWRHLEGPALKVLRIERHNKKLKRGIHQGNQFEVLLKNIQGDKPHIETLLTKTRDLGTPNYFGPQRFGKEGENIQNALNWLLDPKKQGARDVRSIYLSTLRSVLFNCVLGERVKQGSWSKVLAGELAQLNGTHSFFLCETPDNAISERLAKFDIHPTGPLVGAGKQPGDEVFLLESNLLAPFTDIVAALEREGLNAQRRSLRIRPDNFQWQWEDDASLRVKFDLPAGAFATTVLREAFHMQASPVQDND